MLLLDIQRTTMYSSDVQRNHFKQTRLAAILKGLVIITVIVLFLQAFYLTRGYVYNYKPGHHIAGLLLENETEHIQNNDTNIEDSDISNRTNEDLGNGISEPNTTSPNSDEYIQTFPVTDTGSVDCLSLFEDRSSPENYQAARRSHKTQWDIASYIRSHGCAAFIQSRSYIQRPLSPEEAAYPLSFTVMTYKDAVQFERHLRAIYHPQNSYCVHVDVKSDVKFHDDVQTMVGCLPGVFLASRPVGVVWGGWSVVQAELGCLEDLVKHNQHWKYHMNLAATEFPLKTNWELVRIFKAINGSNIVDAQERFPENRLKKKYSGPPFNIKLRKGYFMVAVKRAFAEFVIHSNTSKVFQDWLKDTVVPDETFFASLNTNPHLGAPGAYTGSLENRPFYHPDLARHVQWWDTMCDGKYVHEVCILGPGDLKYVYNNPRLFLNKLDLSWRPFVYDCMEQLHFNRTRAQYHGHREFNDTIYRNVDISTYHV